MSNNKSSFSVDFRKFDKTFFPLVEKEIPKFTAKGIFNAAAEMLQDADKEAPQTPFEHGDLRGSKKIEKPEIKYNKISVDAGYNIKYAAKLHESDPGQYHFVPRKGIVSPGRKWLESKMAAHKEKYMKIAATAIKNKEK